MTQETAVPRPAARHLLFAPLWAACLLALAPMAQAAVTGNPNVPSPTKPVDIDRYVGRYYELARYENVFQRGCEAVSADYSRMAGGLIRIVNTCRDKTPDGPVRSVDGRAKLVEGSRNAKFKVSFFGPLFLGDYWVLDRAEDYSWAIVSDHSGKFLWLLHRDPTPQATVRTALVAKARALGFNTDMLRFTRQGTEAKGERAK